MIIDSCILAFIFSFKIRVQENGNFLISLFCKNYTKVHLWVRIDHRIQELQLVLGGGRNKVDLLYQVS